MDRSDSPANVFDVRRDANRLMISCSASLENIDRACEQVRKFLQALERQDEIFPACLGLREGGTNAVVHGHEQDPGGLIRFALTLTEEALRLEIEDGGKGFDWRSVASVMPQPDVEKGRGLFILRHYFPLCRYNEKGNKLFLERKLPPR